MLTVFELLQRLDVQSMDLVTLLRPSGEKVLGKVQQMSTTGSGGVTLVISDRYHRRFRAELSAEVLSVSGDDEPVKNYLCRWNHPRSG